MNQEDDQRLMDELEKNTREWKLRMAEIQKDFERAFILQIGAVVFAVISITCALCVLLGGS